MNQKPNIVVIIADDLGYGDVSMNGSEILPTPHIDAIANRGIRFTNFHSNGAVCSPTRAAFLTGCYQQRSGITGVLSAANHRDHGLDPEKFTSMATLLKQADYRTALFGKWHVGYDVKYNPTAHGFDLFKGFVAGNVDYQSHVDQIGTLDWWNGDTIQNEPGYTTDLITRYGVQFIEDSQDTPFFLTLAHECPHYPYQGPNDIADREPGVCPERNLIHGSRIDKEEAYVEMMQSMDQGIGEIVTALEKTDQMDNTLMIFFSDNGPSGIGSSGPLRGGKGALYEGGHRIPACVMWPGVIPEGQTSDETVLGMDIYATAASLAEVPLPEKQKVDGVDLMPLMKEAKELEARSTFWSKSADQTAIRKGPWKLVQDHEKVELFDLAEDLGETEDLSEHHPERTASLLEEIRVWKEDVNAGVGAL